MENSPFLQMSINKFAFLKKVNSSILCIHHFKNFSLDFLKYGEFTFFANVNKICKFSSIDNKFAFLKKVNSSILCIHHFKSFSLDFLNMENSPFLQMSIKFANFHL